MRYQLKDDPRNGLLHFRAETPLPGYWRYLPSPDLAPYVEHYWTIEWDLAEPTLRETLPYPSVHIVLEPGLAQLGGVSTRKYSRVLEGRSRVLGVKFRPGGLRPFVDQPVSNFTDRVLPLDEVFGPAAAGLDARALAHSDHHLAIGVVEEFLRRLGLAEDRELARVVAIAERIADDRSIRQVEQLSAEFGIGVRTLQRLFASYVGVSPKWMIRRYRLQEAAQRVAAGGAISWARLGLELGYSDQAHFIRDFRALVGATPGDYRRGLG